MHRQCSFTGSGLRILCYLLENTGEQLPLIILEEHFPVLWVLKQMVVLSVQRVRGSRFRDSLAE